MRDYFKAVTLDKKSWYDQKTLWEPGAVIKPDSVDLSGDPCGHGIHCSPNILGAVQYQQGPSVYCLVKPHKIIASDETKARCESVTCIRFLTMAETDNHAGFKLWEANHPVNPLLIKPKQKSNKWLAENLKAWVLVWDSVKEESVWASVRASVRASVMDSVKEESVWASVRASVRASVGPRILDLFGILAVDSVLNSAYAYIGGLFQNIKTWKYINKPDPWRPLLNLWYAGYIPSFDGETWRIHSGEKARIVFEWRLKK